MNIDTMLSLFYQLFMWCFVLHVLPFIKVSVWHVISQNAYQQ